MTSPSTASSWSSLWWHHHPQPLPEAACDDITIHSLFLKLLVMTSPSTGAAGRNLCCPLPEAGGAMAEVGWRADGYLAGGHVCTHVEEMPEVLLVQKWWCWSVPSCLIHCIFVQQFTFALNSWVAEGSRRQIERNITVHQKHLKCMQYTLPRQKPLWSCVVQPSTAFCKTNGKSAWLSTP